MVRVLACWLILLLVVQGFAVAGQRVLPHGHVHQAPLHGHDAGTHFHVAIGHHAHDPGAPGVVVIDEETAAAEFEMSQTIKRLVLDQPQLAPKAPRADAPVARPAPHRLDTSHLRSHIGEPQERPPRTLVL